MKIHPYIRPMSLKEALETKSQFSGSQWLSGGTYLLPSGYNREYETVIDCSRILESGCMRNQDGSISIGALTSFQTLIDSKDCPELLRSAAASMHNRNIRNRATIGGNLGADKACSSLIPALLALDAQVEYAEIGYREYASCQDWLQKKRETKVDGGLVCTIRIPQAAPGTTSVTMYDRWARTTNDLAILSVAVSLSFVPEGPASAHVGSSQAASSHDASTRADAAHGAASQAASFHDASSRADAAHGATSQGATSHDLSSQAAPSTSARGYAERRFTVRIALGGFDKAARRYPEIESLVDAAMAHNTLPAGDTIAALLFPISDQRGSSDYKKRRGTLLIVDCLETCLAKAGSNLSMLHNGGRA